MIFALGDQGVASEDTILIGYYICITGNNSESLRKLNNQPRDIFLRCHKNDVESIE